MAVHAREHTRAFIVASYVARGKTTGDSTMASPSLALLKNQSKKIAANAEDAQSVPAEASEVDEVMASDADAEVATKAPKSKKKSNAVVKSEVLSGEILDKNDGFAIVVSSIQQMNEQVARATVKELNEQGEFSMFRLGGVLSLIQENNWFTPYANFRELVEKEYGLHYRKAMYYINIYNCLVESEVPWGKVKHLGWTKLKELAPILTKANVDEWVKIAEGQSTLQLIETLSKTKQQDATKALTHEDKEAKTVTTKTFKVHEDQREVIEAAIEKAKKETNTEFDTVALEAICSEFIGKPSKAQPIEVMLKTLGAEAALKAFEKAFPNIDLDVTVNETVEQS